MMIFTEELLDELVKIIGSEPFKITMTENEIVLYLYDREFPILISERNDEAVYLSDYDSLDRWTMTADVFQEIVDVMNLINRKLYNKG